MDRDHPKPARGRALKWAFGISLALNLVFVGLIAGAAMRFAGDERDGRRGPPALQSYGAPFVRALPREAKRSLHRALRAKEAGLPTRAERRAVYQQMAELLRADPFDATAVEAIIGTQQQVAQGVQARAQSTWLTIVSEMSATERAGVADRLQNALDRKHHKDKKRP